MVNISLIISIIALIIPIWRVYIKYLKRLTIKTKIISMDTVNIGLGYTDKNKGLEIKLTNIGNRNIEIVEFGLNIKKDYYNDINESNPWSNNTNSLEKRGQFKIIVYDIRCIKDYITKNNLNSKLNKKVYVYACDSEGKNYKKYIGTLNDILSYNEDKD